MTAATNLKPGDALYYVPGPGQSRPVVIDKVGRKWITFVGEEFRTDKTSMRPEIPSFGTAGRLYTSEGVYRALVQRQLAWVRLQKLVREHCSPPGHLTTEQIKVLHEIIEKGGSV